MGVGCVMVFQLTVNCTLFFANTTTVYSMFYHLYDDICNINGGGNKNEASDMEASNGFNIIT